MEMKKKKITDGTAKVAANAQKHFSYIASLLTKRTIGFSPKVFART